ncbi:hypothetical protein EVAR_68665_1 [Eumeta japonica]|uniref:Uncharacterized protein n=1 Tax=Eumeta variegata TaxID=151549 RepID=A0A4C2A1E7_EUMVA|nr:hypothetical protein EVAR_68665_1 [Eumeta japonica]
MRVSKEKVVTTSQDTRKPKEVTSVLPDFWIANRNSHSLEETQQRRLLIHVCILYKKVDRSSVVKSIADEPGDPAISASTHVNLLPRLVVDHPIWYNAALRDISLLRSRLGRTHKSRQPQSPVVEKSYIFINIGRTLHSAAIGAAGAKQGAAAGTGRARALRLPVPRRAEAGGARPGRRGRNPAQRRRLEINERRYAPTECLLHGYDATHGYAAQIKGDPGRGAVSTHLYLIKC